MKRNFVWVASGRSRRSGVRSAAFTLVELLVVIGIIGVLIAILLPALRGARKQANALVCASNMRQLMLGAVTYATENRGYFPGPNTTGVTLHRNGAYGGAPTSPVQDWDFLSPIMGRQMNFPAGATEAIRLRKFQAILMDKLRCPENDFRYQRLFSGSPLPMTASGGDQPYVTSYMTPAFFHLLSGKAGLSASLWEVAPSGEAVELPPGYVPKVSKVGNAARKIFAFEGARYLDTSFGPTALDYSTVTNTTGLLGTPQGNFTSRGPAFVGVSGEPYTRDAQNRPSAIYKLVSLRHGGKMDVVFFDGHVERLGDQDVSKLDYFVPKGAIVTNQNGIAFNIVGGKVQWKIGSIVP